MLEGNTKKEEATGGSGRHEYSLVSNKKLLRVLDIVGITIIVKPSRHGGTDGQRDQQTITTIYC